MDNLHRTLNVSHIYATNSNEAKPKKKKANEPETGYFKSMKKVIYSANILT